MLHLSAHISYENNSANRLEYHQYYQHGDGFQTVNGLPELDQDPQGYPSLPTSLTPTKTGMYHVLASRTFYMTDTDPDKEGSPQSSGALG